MHPNRRSNENVSSLRGLYGPQADLVAVSRPHGSQGYSGIQSVLPPSFDAQVLGSATMSSPPHSQTHQVVVVGMAGPQNAWAHCVWCEGPRCARKSHSWISHASPHLAWCAGERPGNPWSAPMTFVVLSLQRLRPDQGPVRGARNSLTANSKGLPVGHVASGPHGQLARKNCTNVPIVSPARCLCALGNGALRCLSLIGQRPAGSTPFLDT